MAAPASPFPIGPRDFPDRAFQELLKRPENLSDFVQVAAPDLAPRLDCLHAELRDPRFYLRDWQRLVADVLFNVPIVGSDASVSFAVLLVEQQTSAEDVTVFRTSLHHHFAWAEDWKAWVEGHPRGAPLRLKPPIPIIMHTGATPWNAARELRELFDAPDDLLGFVPVWKPIIWEVSQYSPQELLSLSSPWMKTFAVVRAEKEPPDVFEGVYEAALGQLNPWAEIAHVRWHELVRFLASWALNRRKSEERVKLAEIAVKIQSNAQQREEVEGMFKTGAEALIEEGEIKGELKGELKANRQAVSEVLKWKFPNKFDESAAVRVQTADNPLTLSQWFQAALHAESWKDFRKQAGWPKGNGHGDGNENGDHGDGEGAHSH